MRIWIDLVNSPHIPFFIPIIHRLKEQGHEVLVTYREFAQTAQLVRMHNLDATLIGGHGGKGRVCKFYNLLHRTLQLVSFAKNKKIDLAISHNSYFQLVAAKLLRISSMTSMDFEGQPANHIAFRLASLVSVPDAFPIASLKKFGAKNVSFYQGLKEHICLADFSEQDDFLQQVKSAFHLSDADLIKPLIIVRPPPSLALYHNNEESLFEVFLERISTLDLTVLVLPRVEQQRIKISKKHPSFFFSEQVLDGLQLIRCVDAVVSGGGSMNREAACLGVPAISFFSGELPAVDKQLQMQGKLTVINTEQQVTSITFSKKSFTNKDSNENAINDFMIHIKSVVNMEYV